MALLKSLIQRLLDSRTTFNPLRQNSFQIKAPRNLLSEGGALC